MKEDIVILKGKRIRDVRDVVKPKATKEDSFEAVGAVEVNPEPGSILVKTEPDPGIKSSEFYTSIITAAAVAVGALLLIWKGQYAEATKWMMGVVGTNAAYTAVRGFVKR